MIRVRIPESPVASDYDRLPLEGQVVSVEGNFPDCPWEMVIVSTSFPGDGSLILDLERRDA